MVVQVLCVDCGHNGIGAGAGFAALRLCKARAERPLKALGLAGNPLGSAWPGWTEYVELLGP